MDGRRFDQMIVTVTAGSRRGVLRLLALLVALVWRPAEDAEAGKDTGGRKGGKSHGRNRTRRHHARRRRHQHKKKKKPEPPPECSPENPDGRCEGNQLCIAGACQACDVTCEGEPAACGAALQTMIFAAPTEPISVCPGRYGGGFVIVAGVEIIGAGDGDDPSVDTILEAISIGRVLGIGPGQGEVRLERLRITGGNEGTSGGGISSNSGRTLTMRHCTVSGNQAVGVGFEGLGGGIYNTGPLMLDDCRIEENTATRAGGGIYSFSQSCALTGTTQVRGNEAGNQGGGLHVNFGTVTIGADCRVTANTAPAGQGGGIFNGNADSVTLENDQIVTDNIGGNCAGATIINCNG